MSLGAGCSRSPSEPPAGDAGFSRPAESSQVFIDAKEAERLAMQYAKENWPTQQPRQAKAAHEVGFWRVELLFDDPNPRAYVQMDEKGHGLKGRMY